MKIQSLIQGTPEWLEYRRNHFNASDAPAMMGVSPYKTRSELLREIHTGLTAEVDADTQIRFDEGHRFEALARPLAEEIIGQELYPVTGSNGRLSASFDGLTLAEDEGFEHKRLNADIREAFNAMDRLDPHDDAQACRLLPVYHRVQMEQQLHISAANRILFMSSEWAADGNLVQQRHCWYYPDAELRAAILQGWDQFEKDLAAYVPPTKTDPAPTGRAPDSLPALRIEVTGAVTASNLAEFKQTALAAIGSVNRDLKTDQDFADAEKAVKWCSEAETRLAAAKQHALSQTASIDELFRTMDEISSEARRVRLDLEKLVKARKEAIRGDIVTDARHAWREHIACLQGEIEGLQIGLGEPDFAGAIKGKRTIDSLRDAVDTLLAQSKIAANDRAGQIRASLAVLRSETAGFEFLFRDRAALAMKPAEDVRQLVQARITEHRAAEEKRMEAERERIRVEEADRVRREAEDRERKRLAEEKAAAVLKDASAQAAPAVEQAIADAAVSGIGGYTVVIHPDDSQVVYEALSKPVDVPPGTTLFKGELGMIDGVVTIIADTRLPLDSFESAPWVMPTSLDLKRQEPVDAVARATVADEKATVKLGEICDWLGFAVRADFLAETLKIPHRDTDKAAKLYFPSDRLAIGRALIAHIGEKLGELGD